MNKNCQKWHEQIQTLREKRAEFLQTYADALKFGEQNPKIRETSFTRCRVLFNEIKPLVVALREQVPRLTKEQKAQLSTLKDRFNQNPNLHKEILESEGNKLNPKEVWKEVENRLKKNPKQIDSLMKMEETGGEPDLIWYDKEKDQYIFVDCSKESPAGRRNVCYDSEGQKKAEANGEKPLGNAVDMAAEMGIDLLTKEEYEKLQELGQFDLITWTWLGTPAHDRKTGRGFRGCKRHDVFRINISRHDSELSSFRAALRV